MSTFCGGTERREYENNNNNGHGYGHNNGVNDDEMHYGEGDGMMPQEGYMGGVALVEQQLQQPQTLGLASDIENFKSKLAADASAKGTRIQLFLGDQNVSLADLANERTDVAKRLLNKEAQMAIVDAALKNSDPVAVQRYEELKASVQRQRQEGKEPGSERLSPDHFKIIVHSARLLATHNTAPVALGVTLVGLGELSAMALTSNGDRHTAILMPMQIQQFENNGGRLLTPEIERLDLRAVIGDFDGYNSKNLADKVVDIPYSPYMMCPEDHPVVRALIYENEMNGMPYVPVKNEHGLISVKRVIYDPMFEMVRDCMEANMSEIGDIGIHVTRANLGSSNPVGKTRATGSSWTSSAGLISRTSDKSSNQAAEKLVNSPFTFGVSLEFVFSLA